MSLKRSVSDELVAEKDAARLRTEACGAPARAAKMALDNGETGMAVKPDPFDTFKEESRRILADGMKKALRMGRAQGLNQAAEFLLNNIKQEDHDTLELVGRLLTMASEVALEEEKDG
jgi:hypothetical protein